MVSPRLAAFTVLSALVGSSVATFQILSPGGPDLWWDANSQNTLLWSCHDNPPASTNGQYVLLLNNTDRTVYPGPGAIMANINNADCSEIVPSTAVSLKPATGYTVALADMADQTKIYAVSQQFEIKAQGAAYPATTATPTDTAGLTAGASGTGSATGSAASSSSTTKSNGAPTTFGISAAGVLAAIGTAIGLL